MYSECCLRCTISHYCCRYPRCKLIIIGRAPSTPFVATHTARPTQHISNTQARPRLMDPTRQRPRVSVVGHRYYLFIIFYSVTSPTQMNTTKHRRSCSAVRLCVFIVTHKNARHRLVVTITVSFSSAEPRSNVFSRFFRKGFPGRCHNTYLSGRSPTAIVHDVLNVERAVTSSL